MRPLLLMILTGLLLPNLSASMEHEATEAEGYNANENVLFQHVTVPESGINWRRTSLAQPYRPTRNNSSRIQLPSTIRCS